MKKILICDDHSIIRGGLMFLIANHFADYEVVEAQSIRETTTYFNNHNPNFAILDLQLSDGNIIDVLPAIFENQPKLDVLIFSMSNEEIYGKRLLKLGAKGFLNKNSDEEEVIRALQIFLSGNNYISQKLNDLMLKDLRGNSGEVNDNPFQNLSNREIEVTKYLLEGVLIKDISTLMSLHANTIVTYKHRIFQKLYIKSTVELSTLARIYNFV